MTVMVTPELNVGIRTKSNVHLKLGTTQMIKFASDRVDYFV